MKNTLLLAAALLASVPAFAQGPAYVQPMFSGGGQLRPSQLWIDPTGQNDLDSDAIAWEDFELPETRTITRVRWWGEAAPGLGFTISFFNQDPNTIAVQPDMFRPGSGPIREDDYTSFTQTSVGGSLHRFEVALAAPMTFQANTRYFISIVGRQPIAYAYWQWAQGTNGVHGTFWWMRGLHMYQHLADDRAVGLATSDGFPLGEAFCFGDGSSIACPCGNHGAAGNGCANSFEPAGANLRASGNASVSADSAHLFASGLSGSVAIFFQGSAQTAPSIVDDGLGCVGGSIVRLGNKPASGTSSYPQAGDASISVRGAIPAAGGSYFYQCYYRNAASAFCPPATSNRTNGLAIVWAP